MLTVSLPKSATTIVMAMPILILIILIMVILKHILWYHTNTILLGKTVNRVGVKMRR